MDLNLAHTATISTMGVGSGEYEVENDKEHLWQTTRTNSQIWFGLLSKSMQSKMRHPKRSPPRLGGFLGRASNICCCYPRLA